LASVVTCFAREGGNTVIGKWAEVGNPQNTIQFNDDYSLTVIQPEGRQDGKWQMDVQERSTN
jgi:hypothetical protein